MVEGLRTVTDDIQDPTLAADELEIYFVSPNGGVNDIWRSQRATVDDSWQAASIVTELSSAAADEDPDLSPDGLTMYLSSDRLQNPGVMRLYVSQRAARDQPWETPQPVTGLGSSSADVAPSVDGSGLTMIFATLRGTPDLHLFSASRADVSAPWGDVTELADINSSWQDRDPAMFDHERALVFASRRTGQGRTSDLFQVIRTDATAAFVDAPAPLTELNTDAWEGDPWLSSDGRHLLFMSDRSGTSRIYEARR